MQKYRSRKNVITNMNLVVYMRCLSFTSRDEVLAQPALLREQLRFARFQSGAVLERGGSQPGEFRIRR